MTIDNISPSSEHTGIYMAFPTTSELKQTYRNHTSMVNDQHTKVGITVKSFRVRIPAIPIIHSVV